jgi:hypothetical protein
MASDAAGSCTGRPPELESYSLWLIPPEGAFKQHVEEEMALLAQQHPGSPTFPAHVTLLGNIMQPRAAVLETAKQLAAKLKAGT